GRGGESAGARVRKQPADLQCEGRYAPAGANRLASGALSHASTRDLRWENIYDCSGTRTGAAEREYRLPRAGERDRERLAGTALRRELSHLSGIHSYEPEYHGGWQEACR